MGLLLIGTNKDDRLIGGNLGDVIRGRDGNDTLDGGRGKDYLYGEDGNDILVAGYDDGTGDVFDGGSGTDTYRIDGSEVDHLSFNVNLLSGKDQYSNRYVSIENLIGGRAADVFVGNDIANNLDGRDGNDTIRGKGGDDVLYGGSGEDSLEGGTGADLLNGGAGQNDVAIYLNSTAGVAVNLSTGHGFGGEAEGDTLENIENVLGSKFDDTLVGDRGNNRLNGHGGDDTLEGGDGDDTLIGGAGSDVLDGGSGNDTVSYEFSGSKVSLNLVTGGFGGRAGGDVFISIENVAGSDYADTITGNESINRLNGGAGDDTLNGAGGNDQLIGGEGADRLIGGAGIDTANYGAAKAAVVVDLVEGGTAGEAAGDTYSSIEFVLGTDFDDTITGDAYDNRLTGGDGNDILSGNGGKDTLVGGGGNDVLSGGAGYDVFWFRDAAQGSDTITDFWAGTGMTDRIWLGASSGVSSFADVLANCSDTAEGVVIVLDNGTLLLAGVFASALSSDDFII